MMNETDEEKLWDSLTKEYLTIEQKLDIIRGCNKERSIEEWNKLIESLRDYLNKKGK